MVTNNLVKELTTGETIDKVFEANKAVIALAYSEATYTNPPPTDVQATVAALLAPLMASLIMKGNNFVISSVLSTKQSISITDFKEDVADIISKWEQAIRTGEEFAGISITTRVQ